MSRAVPVLAFLSSLLLGLGACGGDSPTPSGAVCPTGGTTVTYDNFVKGFMETHCTRCHDSALPRSQRHGAPLYHDFDTEVGVLEVAGHVDEQAAAGPDAVNEFMPDDGETSPTLEERQKLGEYLACNADLSATPDD